MQFILIIFGLQLNLSLSLKCSYIYRDGSKESKCIIIPFRDTFPGIILPSTDSTYVMFV
jgi:hypothetical protein